MKTFIEYSKDGSCKMETRVYMNCGPYSVSVAEVENSQYFGVAFYALAVMRVLGLPKETIRQYSHKETKWGTPAIVSIGGRPYFTAVFVMYLSYKAEHVELFQWVDGMSMLWGDFLEANDVAYKICAKWKVARAIPESIQKEIEETPDILTDLME